MADKEYKLKRFIVLNLVVGFLGTFFWGGSFFLIANVVRDSVTLSASSVVLAYFLVSALGILAIVSPFIMIGSFLSEKKIIIQRGNVILVPRCLKSGFTKIRLSAIEELKYGGEGKYSTLTISFKKERGETGKYRLDVFRFRKKADFQEVLEILSLSKELEVVLPTEAEKMALKVLDKAIGCDNIKSNGFVEFIMCLLGLFFIIASILMLRRYIYAELGDTGKLIHVIVTFFMALWFLVPIYLERKGWNRWWTRRKIWFIVFVVSLVVNSTYKSREKKRLRMEVLSVISEPLDAAKVVKPAKVESIVKPAAPSIFKR